MKEDWGMRGEGGMKEESMKDKGMMGGVWEGKEEGMKEGMREVQGMKGFGRKLLSQQNPTHSIKPAIQQQAQANMATETLNPVIEHQDLIENPRVLEVGAVPCVFSQRLW